MATAAEVHERIADLASPEHAAFLQRYAIERYPEELRQQYLKGEL